MLTIRKKRRKCRSCGEKLISKKKICVYCRVDNRSWIIRHRAVATMCAILVLLSLGEAVKAHSSNYKSSHNSLSLGSNSQVDEDQKIINAGEMAVMDKFEVAVGSIEEKNMLEGGAFSVAPSEGGIYVAVQWQYKNVSGYPVGSAHAPKINLLDCDGIKYSSDSETSAALAKSLDMDVKTGSDLNPRIVKRYVEVFEISESSYREGGWKLLVNSGCESAILNIN